jgi:broad specificity phosphatase PhoE
VRLILVRHAQTTSNVGRALDTAHPGAALTDLGLEQAARLAATLAAQPLDAVAASPLLRAQQTAAAVASPRGIMVATLDGLREIAAGEREMQSSADAIDTYRTVLLAWATGDLGMVMPGGTSGHEFLAAFDESVRAIEDGALTAVAVSHGAAIRTWVAARCRDVDPAAISGRPLPNTGALIVEGSAGSGWRLAAWLDEADDAAWGALRDPTGSSVD